MGCFGYICKHCGSSIRGDCFSGGEHCVMIHVRSGEEVGWVDGHYDEYGRVIEQEGMDEELKFRGDGKGVNSHNEICNSEFRLEDSYSKVSELKIYNDKRVTFERYCKEIISADIQKVNYDITSLPYYSLIKKEIDKTDVPTLDEYIEKYQAFMSLNTEDKGNALIEQYHLDFLAKLIIEVIMHKLYKSDNIFKCGFDYLEPVVLEAYSGIVAYHKKCYNQAIKQGTFNLIPSEYDPNQSWGKVRKKYI